MADLSITAADVAAADTPIEQFTGPAAEAITAGQYCRLNVTYGTVELGNGADTTENRDGGIAINSAAIGMPVTVVRKGLVDLGGALDALAYDLDVYLSDTDGALGSDAADSATNKIVGQVVPVFSQTTPEKLLRVDL